MRVQQMRRMEIPTINGTKNSLEMSESDACISVEELLTGGTVVATSVVVVVGNEVVGVVVVGSSVGVVGGGSVVVGGIVVVGGASDEGGCVLEGHRSVHRALLQLGGRSKLG